MVYTPARPGSGAVLSLRQAKLAKGSDCRRIQIASLILFVAIVVISPILLAQGNAQVTSVDPPSGKANDSVTVIGENLGKESVSAVFLSDDKDDFKATIDEQPDLQTVVTGPQE